LGKTIWGVFSMAGVGQPILIVPNTSLYEDKYDRYLLKFRPEYLPKRWTVVSGTQFNVEGHPFFTNSVLCKENIDAKKFERHFSRIVRECLEEVDKYERERVCFFAIVGDPVRDGEGQPLTVRNKKGDRRVKAYNLYAELFSW